MMASDGLMAKAEGSGIRNAETKGDDSKAAAFTKPRMTVASLCGLRGEAWIDSDLLLVCSRFHMGGMGEKWMKWMPAVSC